jgi:hypothetical protein
VDEDVAANQLSLAVPYDDEHVIQVECRAAISRWSAVARAYTSREQLRALGQITATFGESLKGPVTWEAGADNGIGFIALTFYKIDRAGHIRCHVRLSSEGATRQRPEEIWRFEAELATEAADVTSFARQVVCLAAGSQERAVLSGYPCEVAN